MFNASTHELPRALQLMLARDADTPSVAELPRRSFLKLGAASGFALGVFPLLSQAQGAAATADTPAAALKPTQMPGAFVAIAPDRHGQPPRIRPGRADRAAHDPGRGAGRRLEQGAQSARHQ
jgi:hypothetical protein